MKFNLKKVALVVAKVVNDNRNAVLFGTGVTMTVACGVMAAKGAPEATRRWAKAKEETSTTKELAKRTALEVAPLYVPSVLAGAAAITAFAISNRELAKKAAGAAAAASVVERFLNAYQEKVIEEFGEEAQEKILAAIVDDVPDEVVEEAADPVVANRFQKGINDKLYYDRVTGRYFWSDEERIKEAESTVNKIIIDQGVACINDFYNALLLDCDSTLGDVVGFNIEDPHARNMDIFFGSRLDLENHVPLITIGYRTCILNARELIRR